MKEIIEIFKILFEESSFLGKFFYCYWQSNIINNYVVFNVDWNGTK